MQTRCLNPERGLVFQGMVCPDHRYNALDIASMLRGTAPGSLRHNLSSFGKDCRPLHIRRLALLRRDALSPQISSSSVSFTVPSNALQDVPKLHHNHRGDRHLVRLWISAPQPCYGGGHALTHLRRVHPGLIFEYKNIEAAHALALHCPIRMVMTMMIMISNSQQGWI